MQPTTDLTDSQYMMLSSAHDATAKHGNTAVNMPVSNNAALSEGQSSKLIDISPPPVYNAGKIAADVARAAAEMERETGIEHAEIRAKLEPIKLQFKDEDSEE